MGDQMFIQATHSSLQLQILDSKNITFSSAHGWEDVKVW